MRWSLLLLVMGFACQDVERQVTRVPVRFEVSPDRAQIGFDTSFSIVAHLHAAARGSFDIRWTQVGGPALRDVVIGEGGLRFSARTPRLADCKEGPLPWGVIPLSPRTRGEIVLRAEWRFAPDGTSHKETIVVAAAVRSRGLPNVPVDQRLYLGGSGWRINDAPSGASTNLDEHEGIASLRPNLRGTWQLVDGEGHALRIQAGRYVETPLDCGRAGCHAEIARVAQSSPMTWALAHRLQGGARQTDASGAETRSAPDLACAVRCHVTGEPETHDGGFFEVASDLGVPVSLERVGEVTELPRALRRLGSVGCLACHGPSALPEAHARWSILRSDVCAHCHDAPPRYGHVVAWRSTNMARADQDPRSRLDRACTPCHTTWGFLRELDARHDDQTTDRSPPTRVGAVGIACAACHAVHEGSTGSESRPSLLRVPHLAAMFDDVPAEARTRSATCLACHAPRGGARLAQASAAALWAGRAGVDPETGAPLIGPSPHFSVQGGCVGCHRDGPDDIEHGQNHGFRANPRRCTSCHDSAQNVTWSDERAKIEKQTRDLWGDLLAAAGSTRESAASPLDPPHAKTAPVVDAETPLGRAAYDLSLLLEDRGFLAHNLPYARLLLEAVKKPIENASRAARRNEIERGR